MKRSRQKAYHPQRLFFTEYLPLGKGVSRRRFKRQDLMQRLKGKSQLEIHKKEKPPLLGKRSEWPRSATKTPEGRGDKKGASRPDWFSSGFNWLRFIEKCPKF